MSNINDLYTPAELEALIAGETVSKTVKESTAANRIKENPVVSEEQRPSTFSPKSSIPINSRTPVSRPVIKDQSGKRVSSDHVVTPSKGTFDRIDEDLKEAREAAEAQDRAQRDIKRVASPENLLNRLNAQHRLITKMQKELKALKGQG